MKTFFTSDYHFKHKNILKYDPRPFETIEEHDEEIIKRHNEVVKAGDAVYFLGDFALGGTKAQWINYVSRMNGNFHFIRGNHDSKDIVKMYEQTGIYLGELKNVKVGEQNIVLCHYSMQVWNRSHHGAFHLFGHSHHSLPVDPHSLKMDVGINGNNYYPYSFDQVKEEMSKREFKSIDHH